MFFTDLVELASDSVLSEKVFFFPFVAHFFPLVSLMVVHVGVRVVFKDSRFLNQPKPIRDLIGFYLMDMCSCNLK